LYLAKPRRRNNHIAIMLGYNTRVPPFSPVLIAGLMMRPLPIAPLQPALRVAAEVMQRRHPGVFDRLGALDGTAILIDPIDLPFCLVMSFDAGGLGLRAAAAEAETDASATIRGSLIDLIALIEGRQDGDALFFSRALTIEGDTEAIVMLRNALDGEEIDVIADLASVFGPLSRPAVRLARGAESLLGRLVSDLDTLHSAVLAPAARRAATVGAALDRLDDRVATIEKRVRRDGAARRSARRGDNARA
jgi:predicted lipid carrier protein YhbT